LWNRLNPQDCPSMVTISPQNVVEDSEGLCSTTMFCLWFQLSGIGARLHSFILSMLLILGSTLPTKFFLERGLPSLRLQPKWLSQSTCQLAAFK